MNHVPHGVPNTDCDVAMEIPDEMNQCVYLIEKDCIGKSGSQQERTFSQERVVNIQEEYNSESLVEVRVSGHGSAPLSDPNKTNSRNKEDFL